MAVNIVNVFLKVRIKMELKVLETKWKLRNILEETKTSITLQISRKYVTGIFTQNNFKHKTNSFY